VAGYGRYVWSSKKSACVVPTYCLIVFVARSKRRYIGVRKTRYHGKLNMVARKHTNVSEMAADSCRASSLCVATVLAFPGTLNAPIRSPKHTAAIAVSQHSMFMFLRSSAGTYCAKKCECYTSVLEMSGRLGREGVQLLFVEMSIPSGKVST